MKVRPICAISLAAVLLCCEKEAPKEQVRAGAAEAAELPPAAAQSVSAASPESLDDPSLRRGYGPVDLKFHPCVKVTDDGTVRGERCPAAFVVYGPYVAAPGKSTLHVTFKLHADHKLVVTSDVVSETGQQFHGSLDPQPLNAGETRTLGYRIRLSLPAKALEARIGIQTEAPVDFTITDLSVAVE